MTALTDLRGPLYIDLGKRKKGIDKPDSGLTWQGYNRAPHDGPDKDSRGRWKSGHGSVKALGDMPDFVGSLHDDDIKQAKMHARSLLQAIEMEEKRRKADAPTNPKAAGKPIPAELAERVEAMKVRPIPSDLAYLDKELPKLTIAQLEEMAVWGDVWTHTLPSGNKAEKIRNVKDRLTHRLQSEAITHQTSNSPFSPNRTKDARYAEYRRRIKDADARGDREEYAALVAGFGIAGTGPGLPPEKAETKPLMGSKEWFDQQRPAQTATEARINALTQAIRNAPMGSAEKKALEAERRKLTAEAMGKPAPKAKPETAAQKRKRALDMLSNTPNDENEARKTRLGAAELTASADRMEAGAKAQARAKKPLKASGRKGKDVDHAAIDAIVANPTEADRDNLKAILTGMTLPQIKELAEKHNVGPSFGAGGNKADKINRVVYSMIGTKLDSKGITAGIEQGTLATRGTPKPGTSNLERLAGGKLSDFGSKVGPTHLDTPTRTIGDGQFYGDHYHGDGNMGTAIESLSPKQRSINIGGKRLDDALADIIIMGHAGEPGVSARQVQAFKDIAAQLGQIDSSAANRITRAIADISKPSRFDFSTAVKPGDPEPLERLMHNIDSAAANRFNPDGEVKALAKLMADYREGRESALGLISGVRDIMRRHESQEGFFEIRNAITRAIDELEAMRKAKTLPMRNKRISSTEEIRNARAAVRDAREDLERLYGEDPDNWPEARQDRQVEEYYDMKERLARMEG